ncbi:MAG TPA: aminopeptidase [Longimicrobiaceae bacterium]|nr:aminopeptidase [Longimicrobiaceae bacterium]
MKRIAVAALLGLLVVVPSACASSYLLRQTWEGAKLLQRREPIARLLADPATDPETRRKLRLVLEARAFAADSLRLDAGDSYTVFTEVGRDTLLLVLSAAHKDRFEARTWWFPIVGSAPYKGYFDFDDAREAAQKLDARGFDTYLRTSSAYSTLGFFADPVYSTVLRYGDLDLVNTVIHELFHNTFFASGQVTFNESLASFAGARGAIEFFCRRDGAESESCLRAAAAWQDELRFAAFTTRLVAELQALYGRPELGSEEKVRLREEVFARARARYAAEVRPRLRVENYDRVMERELNNAAILARRIYSDRLDLFERVYRARGGDFRRALHDLVAAARANPDDPYAAVAALAGGRGL